MLTYNTDLHGKTVLVTGAAGFIGYHFIKKILDTSLKCYVIGLDNLNDYYDVSLKEFRLKELMKNSWRHRLGCAILSSIQMRIFKAIWLVFSIFWKHAGIRIETVNRV